MNVSDIIFEMELGGVDAADIADIVELYKSKALNSEMLDEELVKRGYSRIFTVDYDSYDEYDSWDDELSSVEKFPHKHQFRD
jgi:hypothetical protein